MTRVVLASASPGRRRVLRQAGVDPLVIVSGVDEDAVIAAAGSNSDPGDITCALARAKAERVAEGIEPGVATDCVVLGCDSMLHIDEKLCGKPVSVAAARRQWQDMMGRSGQLYTGHCLIRLQDGAVSHVEDQFASTTIKFANLSDADLDAYLASGEPLEVAGGFTIDGLGGWFVDGIDGDASNVVGISLPLIRDMLGRTGLSIAAVWAGNAPI